MPKPVFACLVVLLCAALPRLNAQNFTISYQTPDQSIVCSADTLRITIQNNSAVPAAAAVLELELPAGLAYLPGSVSGATESNIANLQKPVLALPVLNQGAPQSVSVLLQASCELVPAINSGQLFDLLLRVRNGAVKEEVTTSKFQIQTSLLVITQVDNDSISGEKGQILTRTLHVQNTRLGAVRHLFLRDRHAKGIGIHVAGAVAEQNDTTVYTARFDGSFFSQFGDGDDLLEFGETALIKEEIEILDCGIPSYTCRSYLTAEWSCTAQDPPCQGDSTYADVVILPSKLQPKLIFKPTYRLPWDICGDIPIGMSLLVYNEGPVPATNIFIQMRSEDPNILGMDKTSFRLRKGGSTQPLAPVLTEPGLLSACGVTQSGKVTLAIPALAAHDTMEVFFNTYTCTFTCQQDLPKILLNYVYNKPCPEKSTVAADTVRFVRKAKELLEAYVTYDIGDCLHDGETYPFTYRIFTSRLQSDSGFLWLRLDLPWGVEWSPDCPPLIAGTAPVAFSIDSAFTEYPVHRVRMAWPLPFAADSLSLDFCLKCTCPKNGSYILLNDTGPDAAGNFVVYEPTTPACSNCGYKVQTAALLTLTLDQDLACGIPACDSFKLKTVCTCDGDGSGGGGGGGGGGCLELRESQRAARLNYDLADNDDNRIADPFGVLDLKKVRRDRFLPGDTLRSIVSTKVVCGDSIDQLFYQLYTEVVASDFGYASVFDTFSIGPNQGDAARHVFTNNEFLTVANAFVTIWDSSAQAVYTCPIAPDPGKEELYGQIAQVNTKPLSISDQLTTLNYPFRPNMSAFAAQGCVPPGFLLNTGDSIALTVDEKLGFNYTPKCDQHRPPLINFEMGYARASGFYNYRRNDTLMFQYSGYIDSLTTNTFGIKPCEPSVQVIPFSYSTRIARENLFPYEVRPLAKIADYGLVMPLGITAQSAKLLFLTAQENMPLAQNQAIPFVQQDSVLHLDFSQFYQPPPDEGYALRTLVAFEPDCAFTRPDSSALYVTLDFPGCMHMPDPDIRVLQNKIGFFSNHPQDTLTTDELVLDFPTPAVGADVLIRNLAPVAAPNYWMELVNPEGGLSNLGVYLANGAPVLPANGIFQLGSLGNGDKSLHLGGVNNTCDPQRLIVYYGWDCQPHTQAGAPACGRDSIILTFRPQNPEIELQVVSQPPEAPLCDTSDYITFDISNADLGYAYRPLASIELPAGFHLAPGTCQLAYPAGNAFVPIPDPAPAGGNTLQWDLAALQQQVDTNGLPGVNLAPQNALQIRFRVLTECGVVSNAQIVFGARAQWSCGKPTNVLRKAGDPLPVEGLVPGYGVQVNLAEPGGAGPAYCGSERTLSVDLLLSGVALPGDSIYALLPPGFAYVPGSYQPGANAPLGPPQIEGNILRWPVPAGLPANSLVHFTFSVVLAGQPNCSGAVLRVQTRQRTAAFCPAVQTDCAVYVATGEAVYTFLPADPDVVVLGGSVLTGPDGRTDLHFTVGNNSAFPLQPPVFRVYHDVDGDGTLSGPDTLVYGGTLPAGIAPGDSLSAQLPKAFDGAGICQLLLVLPASENCDCNDVVFPLNNNDFTYALQTICLGQGAPVGVPGQSGHAYAWAGPAGLPCTDCPNLNFLPDSAGFYTLTLAETGGACALEHHFSVQVNGNPVLSLRDTAACRGQAVTLSGGPAAQWQWTGPGIGTVATATLTVAPQQTATYQLLATNAAGCTASASATVTPLPADTTDLGTLRTCEGTPVSVFGALTETPGLYRDTLVNAQGCDSLLLRRLEVVPHTEETQALCPRDTLYLSGQTVTAPGTYTETFLSSLGCDSLHYVIVTELPAPDLPDPDTFYVELGQSVQLPSPGAFSTYHWAPADSLSCTDCPSPLAAPIDTTDYVVTVETADGCRDTLVYRVVPFPPCNAARIKVPNAFTPNGDGHNDTFTFVPYEGVEVIERLRIYNRWGQKIYEGSGPKAAWDGTSDGRPAPADVYVWLLEIRCGGDAAGLIKGDVALIR